MVFEPFWDSNQPRFGDLGSLGWKQVLEIKPQGLGDEIREEIRDFEEDLGREEEDIEGNGE